MKEYYTYAYLREDGTPYYIGKGSGRRAYSLNHRIIVPPKDRILILKRFVNECDSLKHETYMIAILGRKDLGTGILENLSEGGSGGASGYVTTPEVRSLRSSRMMGNKIWSGRTHDKEAREKVSKARKGKKLSKDHVDKLKKSHAQEWKITSPEGETIIFSNLNEWCRMNNLNPSALSNYGKYKGWKAEKRNPK
jgi:ribosomal protein L32